MQCVERYAERGWDPKAKTPWRAKPAASKPPPVAPATAVESVGVLPSMPPGAGVGRPHGRRGCCCCCCCSEASEAFRAEAGSSAAEYRVAGADRGSIPEESVGLGDGVSGAVSGAVESSTYGGGGGYSGMYAGGSAPSAWFASGMASGSPYVQVPWYMMPPPPPPPEPTGLIPTLARESLDDVMVIASGQIEEFRTLWAKILGAAETGTIGHAEIATPGSDTGKLMKSVGARFGYDVHFEVGIDSSGKFTGLPRGGPKAAAYADVVWTPKNTVLAGKDASDLILHKDLSKKIIVYDWKASPKSSLSHGLRSVLRPDAQKLVGKVGGMKAIDRDKALSRLSLRLGGSSATFRTLKIFSKAFFLIALIAGAMHAIKKSKEAKAAAKKGDWQGAAIHGFEAVDSFLGIGTAAQAGWKAGDLARHSKIREVLEYYGLPEQAAMFGKEDTFGSLLDAGLKDSKSIRSLLETSDSVLPVVGEVVSKIRDLLKTYVPPLPW